MGLSAEEQHAAYESAGPEEKKLARDLARKGTRRESELLLERYHYLPGCYLVKNAPRLPTPADPG